MCYMANACAFVLDQRSHRRYKLYAMPPSAEHMPARCGRTCAFAWLCEHMIRERLPSTFRRRQGPLLLPCSSCAARICVHPLYVRRPIAVWRARLVGRRQSSKGRQRGGRTAGITRKRHQLVPTATHDHSARTPSSEASGPAHAHDAGSRRLRDARVASTQRR